VEVEAIFELTGRLWKEKGEKGVLLITSRERYKFLLGLDNPRVIEEASKDVLEYVLVKGLSSRVENESRGI
jgi:hypothetical protein